MIRGQWTLSKPPMDRLEACERWCLSRIGRISYLERKTNEDVLALFGTKRKLMDTIKTRKCTFLTTSREMTQY